MTSLQMQRKSVSVACDRIGGTVAYCDPSPSPVSLATRKEALFPAPTEMVRFWAPPIWLIQARRLSLVGSPNRRASRSLRDCHRGTGLSQEKRLAPVPAISSSWLPFLQYQPAPAVL